MKDGDLVRPAGITVLGILMIVAGVVFAGTGFLFAFMGSSTAFHSASNGGQSAAFSTLGAAAGVIFLLFGGLHVVLALGILKMRNVARILTIFLFILSGTGAAMGLIATIPHYTSGALLGNLAIIVADASALWYLLRPHIKEAFGA